MTEPTIAIWPLVDPKDDGIRPAGPPDACFYCRREVGQEHARDCVIVEKLVELRVFREDKEIGTWTLYDPYHWDGWNSEFHKNESSWCAGNFLDERVASGAGGREGGDSGPFSV